MLLLSDIGDSGLGKPLLPAVPRVVSEAETLPFSRLSWFK